MIKVDTRKIKSCFIWLAVPILFLLILVSPAFYYYEFYNGTIPDVVYVDDLSKSEQVSEYEALKAKDIRSVNDGSYCADSGLDIVCWGRHLDKKNGSMVYREPIRLFSNKLPTPMILNETHIYDVYRGAACYVDVNNKIQCQGDIREYGADLVIGKTISESKAIEIRISTGGICALLINGEIKCAGLNPAGVLGVGVYGELDKFSKVYGIDNAIRLIRFGEGYCALLTTRQIKCWGDYAERSGSSDLGGSSIPMVILWLDNIRSIDGFGNYICAVDFKDKMSCWNSLRENSEPIFESYAVTNASSIKGITYFNSNREEISIEPGALAVIGSSYKFKKMISSGGTSMCGINPNGFVMCLGQNEFGQLGNGNISPSSIPNYVSNGSITTIDDPDGIYSCFEEICMFKRKPGLLKFHTYKTNFVSRIAYNHNSDHGRSCYVSELDKFCFDDYISGITAYSEDSYAGYLYNYWISSLIFISIDSGVYDNIYKPLLLNINRDGTALNNIKRVIDFTDYNVWMIWR